MSKTIYFGRADTKCVYCSFPWPYNMNNLHLYMSQNLYESLLNMNLKNLTATSSLNLFTLMSQWQLNISSNKLMIPLKSNFLLQCPTESHHHLDRCDKISLGEAVTFLCSPHVQSSTHSCAFVSCISP